MTPRYTDADLYRLRYRSRTLDLDVDLVEPGDCACRLEAMRRASARGRVQYGQVWPEGDIGECQSPYTFGNGLVALCCSNGDRVVDALNAKGYDGDDLDDELVRRVVRAAVKEALRRPNQEQRLRSLANESAKRAAELEATAVLIAGGHSMAAVNRAGRALHAVSPSDH